MLLRFTVENMLSFRSEASISMIATADRTHPNHLNVAEDSRRPTALRVAAVYGANGHGKSKLVECIIALQRHVRGRPWHAEPFKLDANCANQPTRMILEFRHRGYDFEYGTLIHPTFVAEEWLYATGIDGKEEKLFERATQPLEDGRHRTTVHPGKTLSSAPSPTDDVKMSTYIKVLGSGIKPNESFIAQAEDRDFGIVSDAFHWFDDVLTPVSATSTYSPLFERMTDEEAFRNFVSDYMKRCDVGIESVESKRMMLDQPFLDTMPPRFQARVKELENEAAMEFGGGDGSSMQIEKNADGEVFVRDLTSFRRGSDGSLVKFTLDEESSGTRRLFDLLPMIADDGDSRVYVVDELDRKLHPVLAYEFVQSFIRSSSPQLVFTTHNTHMMSLNLLRRDEIWFVQKRADGSSDLYSLAEMKVRNDLNIRKGYISGRFGAIPFIGNTDDLGWHQEAEEVVADK